MSKIRKELGSIKDRREIMAKISEYTNISIIGVNEGDSYRVLEDLLESMLHNKKNTSVLVLTPSTSTQVAYNIRRILPSQIATLEYKANFSIMIGGSNFTIDISRICDNEINEDLVLHYEHVIVQLANRDDINIDDIRKWYKKNKKSKIIVTAECPKGKEIGFFKLLRLRKYVDNVLFMMYDEEEGDTCFVDRFKRKHVIHNFR